MDTFGGRLMFFGVAILVCGIAFSVLNVPSKLDIDHAVLMQRMEAEIDRLKGNRWTAWSKNDVEKMYENRRLYGYIGSGVGILLLGVGWASKAGEKKSA